MKTKTSKDDVIYVKITRDEFNDFTRDRSLYYDGAGYLVIDNSSEEVIAFKADLTSGTSYWAKKDRIQGVAP